MCCWRCLTLFLLLFSCTRNHISKTSWGGRNDPRRFIIIFLTFFPGPDREMGWAFQLPQADMMIKIHSYTHTYLDKDEKWTDLKYPVL